LHSMLRSLGHPEICRSFARSTHCTPLFGADHNKFWYAESVCLDVMPFVTLDNIVQGSDLILECDNCSTQ
jgi:hypothetical protein